VSIETAEIALPPVALLQVLSDGKIHSGQALAAHLGVSRTMIWKHLAKLEALGLPLISQAGSGYCIEGGLDLLDEETIRKTLSFGVVERIGSLSVFPSIDSTNAFLMRQPPTNDVSVCLAETQTAGRGRRGRQWVSPFGTNIYLSIKLSYETGMSSLEGLSLALGVAVIRALQKLGINDIKLKWPNDILCMGKKLGGILVEVTGDPFGLCYLVVGLGLNVRATSNMSQDIDQPWIALEQVNAEVPTRNVLATALLDEMLVVLSDYPQQRFVAYRDEWNSNNAYEGQLVRLLLGEQEIIGRFVDIDEVGAVCLETDLGVHSYTGGEISLRGLS
jgi:BirA family transcriptional regulator, biotin operon repressor / biotin---[acetyl-CoA-carboxylase] ligase